jgi:uncharacterized membrane protein YphA (DoxX/SURF4 family)
MDLLALATHGIGAHDLAFATARAAVGAFFAISGWHKLFHPARRERFTRTLIEDRVPAPHLMRWWVAGWEFTAGVWLTVGLFSAFSAFVLMVICFVACWAEAPAKVRGFEPIDRADALDDYLYLPEVLYLVILGVVMLGGTGAYSLDAILFPR